MIECRFAEQMSRMPFVSLIFTYVLGRWRIAAYFRRMSSTVSIRGSDFRVGKP
jgi:hypothetical protein